MDRKVFVAIVDREVIGWQVVPNVAQVGKGDDGKGQGKKSKSNKGKNDDGEGKCKGGRLPARKAFDGYCEHCLKWGDMKRIVSSNRRTSVAKAKVQAVLMNLRKWTEEHFSWSIRFVLISKPL